MIVIKKTGKRQWFARMETLQTMPHHRESIWTLKWLQSGLQWESHCCLWCCEAAKSGHHNNSTGSSSWPLPDCSCPCGVHIRRKLGQLQHNAEEQTQHVYTAFRNECQRSKVNLLEYICDTKNAQIMLHKPLEQFEAFFLSGVFLSFAPLGF